LRIASTWFDLRYWVASMSAVSLASVPELVKNTLASGMPDRLGDLLGQLDLVLDQVQRRGVEHLLGLLLMASTTSAPCTRSWW
jgi:hypothetical protein